MPGEIDRLIASLEQYPVSYTLLSLAVLGLLAWSADWLTRHLLLRGLRRLVSISVSAKARGPTALPVISRLSHIVPALVIMFGIKAVPNLSPVIVAVARNVASAFIVLSVALALGKAMDLINSLYQRRPNAHQRPIKGYLQVVQVVIYAIAIILMVASIIDRSPLILLSGLGAMAAVLLLIFQDTLLSLVASVQLVSNDIVRVGDWIEMPQVNADGDVIDMALHTVKVQNWDKTITTIPTKRLISDSFRNWRGMQEAGGRRIKRSIFIDQQSVRFLTDDEWLRLGRITLLTDYLAAKEAELAAWNGTLPDGGREAINRRRATNIGTFRAYVDSYLRSRQDVHQDMILMVRQLDPTADGLPLEVYCFTKIIAWVAYEGVQSDIFDHLLAILPEFGLRVFQHPSGTDMRALGQHVGESTADAGAASG
jgi:miniconductance mechanosensitive channel